MMIEKIILVLVSVIVGAIIGRLMTGLFYSKKESFDVSAKQQEMSSTLNSELTKLYGEYTSTLEKFQRNTTYSLNDFMSIDNAGVLYFSALDNLAGAVLTSNVSKTNIVNSHLKQIYDGYYRSIPAHYRTMNDIAQKCQFSYTGKFCEENYQNLGKVLEKYKKEVEIFAP